MSHTLSVVFITITLYWIDRTTEYRNRLDHLWQLQLSEEQKEAETMLKVNNMLLENILPAHVGKNNYVYLLVFLSFKVFHKCNEFLKIRSDMHLTYRFQ